MFLCNKQDNVQFTGYLKTNPFRERSGLYYASIILYILYIQCSLDTV